jgi:hypothetical protein
MKHPVIRALLLTLIAPALLMICATLGIQQPTPAFGLTLGSRNAVFGAPGRNQTSADQKPNQNDGNQSTNQNVPSSQTGQSSPAAPSAPDQTPKADDSSAKKSDKDKSAKGNDAQPDEPVSRLKITVASAESNKPIGNASVYIRFPDGYTRLTHKEKLSEMNFKTNLDGSVKVPNVPRGKILVQVVAPGWHTYGKWYEADKEEVQIDIKLEKPPQWY